VGGDPASGDPSVEGDAGDSELAGQVGETPLAGAECGTSAPESLFPAADTAQALQQMTDTLGAEVFTALGRTESFAVQGVRDGGCAVTGLGELRAVRCR
jgi:hypothetical protein